MCKLLRGQEVASFRQTSRSVRLSGRSTSVRLEGAFWFTLAEIATREGISVPRLIVMLHDEALEHYGEISNLASLLRTVCVLYRQQ